RGNTPDGSPYEALEREPARIVECDDQIDVREHDVLPRAVRAVENPLTARDGVLDQFDLLLRRTLHPIRKPSDLVCEDHGYTEALCDPLCSGRLSRSCGAVQQDAPRRRRIRISDAQALKI